jgi:8-hydroxy-5-deazaflavin:NADPH oxidoreductase
MEIGIIGSGNIGSTLARLAVAAGFDVVIANRRGPASLAEFVAELGPRARAATVEEVGRDCRFLVEAIPFGQLRVLPLGGTDGQVLVTAANYFPGRDGDIDLGGTQSGYVARLFPQTRVVKAFNTIRTVHLGEQGDRARPLEERRAIPWRATTRRPRSASPGSSRRSASAPSTSGRSPRDASWNPAAPSSMPT